MKRVVFVILLFSCAPLPPPGGKLPPPREEKARNFLQQGRDALRNKEFDKAIELFKEAQHFEGAEEEASYLLIYAYFKGEYLEEAVKAGNLFLKNFPNSVYKDEAYYFLGEVYGKQERWLRSAESYLTVLRSSQNPDLIRITENRLRNILEKNLSYDQIIRLQDESSGTRFYPVVLYYAFLQAHREGKVEERDILYRRMQAETPETRWIEEARKVIKREIAKEPEPVVSEFKVLLMIPRSGEYSSYGKEFVMGFSLGIGTTSIDIQVFDTKSDPLYTYENLRKILEPPPLFIVGPLSTKVALSIYPTLGRMGLPVICPTASDVRIGLFGENIFAFNEGLYYQTLRLSDAVLEEGWQDIAVLYPETGEGESVKDLFVQRLADLNLTPVVIGYSPDSVDFQGEIKFLRGSFVDSLPDAVFLPVTGEKDAINIAPQLRYHKITTPILGTQRWLKEKIAFVGDKYVENAIIVGPAPVSVINQGDKGFWTQFQKTYGTSPSEVSIKGYDAAKLIIEILSIGLKSPTEIVEYLRQKGYYRGMREIYAWKKDAMHIYTFKNREIKELP